MAVELRSAIRSSLTHLEPVERLLDEILDALASVDAQLGAALHEDLEDADQDDLAGLRLRAERTADEIRDEWVMEIRTTRTQIGRAHV